MSGREMDAGRTSPLLWFGAAALLLFVFVQLTGRFLGEDQPGAFDNWVFEAVAGQRTALMNRFFMDLTALGSAALVTLHTTVAFALLLLTRDRRGAIQLAVASGGSYFLIEWMKATIERPRPDLLPSLVDATGFSYPSGHALAAAAMYLTLAMLACRHLALVRQRALVLGFAGGLIASIAFSRIYLGVHYASDVISGILLGTAWALAVAGAVRTLELRFTEARDRSAKQTG